MRFSGAGKSVVTVALLAIVSAALMAYGGAYLTRTATIAACSCLVVCLAAYLLCSGPTARHRNPRGGFTPNPPSTERPPILVTVLFVLLLSGPPQTGSRDPLASIRGEIDSVILFQITVWLIAGLWICRQLLPGLLHRHGLLRLPVPVRLGLLLILILGASTVVSIGPELTAFKVYEMLVMLLFASLLVQEYGVRAYLHQLFVGYATLSLAVVLAAFVAPGLVIEGDAGRMRGDHVAFTGVVTVFALILLCTKTAKVPRAAWLAFVGLELVLLGASRTRTAFAAFLAFLLFGVLVRPAITRMRWSISVAIAAIAVIAVAGLGPGTIMWLVRETESISTLSDRTGLWTHLTDVVISKSPWIGLGYYSGTRVYSLEYNPGLGTAHSAWFEVFAGGGFLGLAALVLLWGALIVCVVRLRDIRTDPPSFASSSLLIAVFSFSITGWGGFDTGPVAFTFWSLVAILPSLRSEALTAIDHGLVAEYSGI